MRIQILILEFKGLTVDATTGNQTLMTIDVVNSQGKWYVFE